MSRNFALVTSMVAALAISACASTNRQSTQSTPTTTRTSTTPAVSDRTASDRAASERAASDRAAVERNPGNVDSLVVFREKESDLPTATDQGGSENDINITRSIRQTIMGNEKLSVAAKNVQIITRDSVVTLRGLVGETWEKDYIAEVARGALGVARVDDHIEIADSSTE